VNAKIHLILADDWELLGTGSGNMRAIQFETMRRLCQVYEAHGLRASFNAEIMQQLVHLRFGRDHDELRQLAQEWEEIVRETYTRGHDIQLHVHPQWSDAAYENGSWKLRGAWSILEYEAERARRMLEEAKDYLEGLLRPLDPDYRCVSFRSGSWCIAPGKHVLRALAELGIVFDMSIVQGIFYDSPHVQLDYREIDEPFLPYYPDMTDARRVAAAPQPIVCMPTHSFDASLTGLGLRFAARAVQRRVAAARPLTRRYVAPRDTPIAGADFERGAYVREESLGSGRSVAERKKRISDLGGLSFFQMREMLQDIRRRARNARQSVVPVVLENHTKDLGDFGPIELFAREVAKAPDIDVITATEAARNLAESAYRVRTTSD